VAFAGPLCEVYAKTLPSAAKWGDTAQMLAFDPATLVPLLRCPVSHAPLRLVGEECFVSTDAATRLRFPITDGFPVLLEEEAETLSEEDWRALLNRADDHGGEDS